MFDISQELSSCCVWQCTLQ